MPVEERLPKITNTHSQEITGSIIRYMNPTEQIIKLQAAVSTLIKIFSHLTMSNLPKVLVDG